MRFEYSAGTFLYRFDKKNNKILFLLLIKENGEYDLPKGHVEVGESPIAAAIRETKEETGLDVQLLPSFSTSVKYFFYKGKERIFKRVKFFIGKASSEKVWISYEHKGYKWLDCDSALKSIRWKNLAGAFPEISRYISKYERMSILNDGYGALPQKGKWDLSKRLVKGEGPLNTKLMLVGQAPGRFEDEQLRPFVGRSGKLLDDLLMKHHIKRNLVYITSVVQFFPPKNRIPTEEEVKLCKPFLIGQINIINPRFIVLLGNLAGGTLLGTGNVRINHGRIVEKGKRRYMITFHPAAALRFKDIYDLMQDDFKKLEKKWSSSNNNKDIHMS